MSSFSHISTRVNRIWYIQAGRGNNREMLDPANDLVPPPSSPTISSISSSDLDTESTGSFFHDRSTTLGTLMGVNFPAITFTAQPQDRDPNTAATAVVGGSGSTSWRISKSKKKKKVSPAAVYATERRRRWWRLCSDGDVKPASLGEFLEVERRIGDGTFYDTATELEGMIDIQQKRNNNGRVLFADGRVLPPANVDDGPSSVGSLCIRFPGSITGVCSGCLL